MPGFAERSEFKPGNNPKIIGKFSGRMFRPFNMVAPISSDLHGFHRSLYPVLFILFSIQLSNFQALHPALQHSSKMQCTSFQTE